MLSHGVRRASYFPHVSDVLRAELLTFTLADELLQLAEREPE